MFGKKKIAAAVMAAFCVTAFAASGFAEEQSETPEAKTVVTVGNETLSDREMLQLLQSSANGNIMMVGLMLTQSTLADRTEMANQMADTMLFAEGARLDGLTEREDIAFKLKWQRIQLLVEAYINERSQKWDMSEKAMKDYYNSHKDEFVQAEGAHVRHILTNTESGATDAILDIYKNKDFVKTAAKFSRDTTTAARGGDLGWVEKGMMPEPLASEIEKAQLKSLSAPVKTDLGWHVFEVLERRSAKQLTFDEARNEVAQRLQMYYIDEDLKALREKLGVQVNEEALENLAGIPAAPSEEPKLELPEENAAPASGDVTPQENEPAQQDAAKK